MKKLLVLVALSVAACGSDPGAVQGSAGSSGMAGADGCRPATTCPTGQSGVTCKNATAEQIQEALPRTAGACSADAATGTWCCAPTPAQIDDSPNCQTTISPTSSACDPGTGQVVTCKVAEAQPRAACAHPSSGDPLVWCCP